jgi:hypothetical protein
LVSIFHIIYFPFIVLAFRDFSSLRAHFLPFTEVLQEIRPDITRKVWKFFKKFAVSPSGDDGMAVPDRFEQKGTKRTSYWLADTNLKAWPSLRVRCSTNSHQLISLFVIICAIRVFTRLRLNGAAAWQAAVFPRKAFESGIAAQRVPDQIEP